MITRTAFSLARLTLALALSIPGTILALWWFAGYFNGGNSPGPF